jgi:hypothetical protein
VEPARAGSVVWGGGRDALLAHSESPSPKKQKLCPADSKIPSDFSYQVRAVILRLLFEGSVTNYLVLLHRWHYVQLVHGRKDAHTTNWLENARRWGEKRKDVLSYYPVIALAMCSVAVCSGSCAHLLRPAASPRKERPGWPKPKALRGPTAGWPTARNAKGPVCGREGQTH